MRFGILGPLQVADDEGHEVVLAAPKQRALLAILLLHANEVVSCDQMVEELWAGEPPAKAAKNLQVHVSRIRRALGETGQDARERLVTVAGGYLLRVAPGELDSERFERLIADGNALLEAGRPELAAAKLRDALALWRGAPLTDFQYESFALADARRLSELHLSAIEQGIGAELALGRGAGAVGELERLVRQHPYRERLHAHLMLALYRDGRQAEALEAYHAARGRLVEELGIEPSAELRGLHEAILAQDDSLLLTPTSRPVADNGADTFVGYERELAALEGALKRALGGRGGVVLLGGEPGIGKSRMAERLAEIARLRGVRVLVGRCWEAGGAPAFWPWVQALRALTRECESQELRRLVGDRLGELAQILPEVAGLLGDTEGERLAERAEERFRMFEAIAGLVRDAATVGPLLVVLDDLHAADEPSGLFLRFMADAVAEARVLIVGAYRDTELGPAHPLRATIGELDRLAGCARVTLKGFAPADTARLVELSAGAQAVATLASAIHRSSAGNPLFVAELVRLLQKEGRLDESNTEQSLELPEGVGDVIDRRLARVSEGCRQTLSLAAVIGREFDLRALAEGRGVLEEELTDELEEAIRAHLIADVPDAPGTMRFSHDLVREGLYRGLSGVRRSSLHKTVGEALERMHAPNIEPHLSELAHHFQLATPGGTAHKALDYERLAAERAASLLAYEEAIRLYRVALETLDSISPAREEERGELLLGLADQFALIGDVGRAKPALLAASREAEHLGSETLRARALLLRADIEVLSGASSTPEFTGLVHSALEVFREQGDALHEARAWGVLSDCHYGSGFEAQAGEAAELMLAAARRAASPGLQAKALDRLAASLTYGPTPATEAIPRLSDMLAETDSSYTESKLLLHLAVLHAMRSDYDHARKLFGQSNAIQERLGDLREHARGLAFGCSQIEMWAGDYAASERFARAGCEIFRRLELTGVLTNALACLAEALIPQGKLSEAGEVLTIAAELPIDPYDLSAIEGQGRARAKLELASGDPAAAVRSARLAVDSSLQTDLVLEQVANWLILADAFVASGEYDDACHAAEQALEIAEKKQHIELASQARFILTTQVGTDSPADHESSELLAATRRPRPDTIQSRELLTPSELRMASIAADEMTTRRLQVSRALMFTDIVKSTDLLSAIGDEAWLGLRSWHDRALRALFALHGGEEVTHTGDGFFIAFTDVAAAVACAVAIQRTLDQHRLEEGFAPSVRIGLHYAPATETPDGYLGRGVHEAARIAGLARAAEIVASADALAHASSEIVAVNRRQVTLKGVRKAMEVVTIEWRSEPAQTLHEGPSGSAPTKPAK